MQELKPLTGLRFLAALYVFLFHMDMPIRTPLTYLPARVEAFIQEGQLGVTVFFVLSGFILTYSHLKDFPNGAFRGISYYLAFMYRRLARIYPVFLAGLLSCLVVSYYFHTLPSPVIVVLSATFLQTYIPSLTMQWYDMGAWSVANEIFFYLLFPLALPLLLRIQRPRHLLVLLAGLVLFGTFLGVGGWRRPNLFPFGLTYPFPPSRFPEFVAGMITALLTFRFHWKAPAWAAGVLLGVVAVYLSLAGPHVFGAMAHNWLVVPMLAVLLNVLAQPQQSPAFKWLGSRPMLYLGRISYSFYIAQHPLVFILDPMIKAGQIRSDDWRVLPIALVVNLVGAVLLHEVVEKKAHRLLMRAYKRRVLTTQSTQLTAS
jgi:peptidoglycan/LPS O-acetylase OafA/YrhL